jgi:hypothetical protein
MDDTIANRVSAFVSSKPRIYKRGVWIAGFLAYMFLSTNGIDIHMGIWV